MRLFSDGSFYLHESSSLAAEWLCDRDTISQLRNTGNLLSTVIQLHTMSRDTRLYPIDVNIEIECQSTCEWLHDSVYNISWMLDYFDCLDSKCGRCFKHSPLTWEFKRALREYLDVFPSVDSSYIVMSPSTARKLYANGVKQFQYRVVKLPFWYDQLKPKRITVSERTILSEGFYLPDSLLDLDLSELLG